MANLGDKVSNTSLRVEDIDRTYLSASGSGTLTLTSSYQRPTGVVVTIPEAGWYLMMGTVDYGQTDPTSNTILVASFHVNGTQGGYYAIAQCNHAGNYPPTQFRPTVGLAWIANLAASDSLDIRCIKYANLGAGVVYGNHTRITGIRIA